MEHSYNLTLKNTLGIRDFFLGFNGGEVVEVTGENASGKTSIALALAAVLAHEGNPDGVPATETARTYLREGSEEGTARLETAFEHEDTEWDPRTGKIAGGFSNEPICTREAVGLVDFTARMTARTRAELFQGCLLPAPEEVLATLARELAGYVPEKDVTGVLREIEARGWKSAEGIYSARARATKQQWAAVTGRSWGSKVAVDWRPEGWLASLEGETVRDVERKQQATRDALQALIGEEAISEAQLQEAEKAKAQLPKAMEETERFRHKHRDAKTDTELINRKVNSCRKTLSDETFELSGMRDDLAVIGRPLTCPSCKAKLAIIEHGELEAYDTEKLEADQVKLQEQMITKKAAIADDKKLLSELKEERKRAVSREATMLEAYQGKVIVSNGLNKAAEVKGVLDTEERQQQISELEREIEELDKQREMASAVRYTTVLQESIARNLTLHRAIGPQGVRARMLNENRDKLVAALEQLRVKSGWPAVVLEGDLIRAGKAKRILARCSESERWRAQAMLQMAIAAITGSPVIVLDRADLLDGAGQAGLVKMARIRQ